MSDLGVSQGSMFGFRQVVDAPESGTVNIPGQLSFDDVRTMHRTDDMDTAVNAAVVAIGHRAAGKAAVLKALYEAGERGLTDFDHLRLNGMVQQSAGKRRLDLQRDGYVRRASDEFGLPAKRPAPTGTPAAVWVLTAQGYMHYESKAVPS